MAVSIRRMSFLVGLAALVMPVQGQVFVCGGGAGTKLAAASLFTGVSGSTGFELQTVPGSFADGACSSEKPFFFSTAVPDGNYKVTVVLGGKQASTTTVKAESRRLMVYEEAVKAGRSKSESFIVNVRTEDIFPRAGEAAGTAPKKVKLKPREIGALDWDNKLTLEFNGEHPSVRSIAIAPVTDVPTLYLAGDSTVVDQDKEPWAAWGQMLPMFFGAGLSIANNAESGETIKSFVGERRLEKVMSTMKAGDYLMVQFAHNDQKPGSGFVSIEAYKDLLRSYIKQAHDVGATPMLVTSMNRRVFDEAGKIKQTLGDYPEATRQVAAEQHVGLIDLNAMSKTLFEAMGPDGTLKAFVHYPANTFPGQAEELKDDTHFNAYGAYELARCIVQAVKDEHLPVEKYLRPGIAKFDPGKPDALTAWHLPASPAISTDTPYGR